MEQYSKKLIDKHMFTIYNRTIAEQMFFLGGSIVNFDAIILANMGKDIYIGMEIPERQERQEAVIKNYRVTTSDRKEYAGEETAFIFSGKEQGEMIELGMKARIDRWNRLFDMIDIEARYQRYFYHIYIMNCINIQNSRLFMRKTETNLSDSA